MKPSILRIERLNYLLGGTLAAAAALTQSRGIAIGVAVGAALTCVNFFVLRRLVVRWTDDSRAGNASRAPYVMLPKMIGLMAAVAVVILVLSIDPLAFAIGYSVFIPSITIEAIYSAVRQGPTTERRDG